MPTTGWRTWAGLLLALTGAVGLYLMLSYPALEFPATPLLEGRQFDLSLMGKQILSFPTGEGDISCVLRLVRVALPLAFLYLGAFLLFLETGAGARFGAYIRKLLGKEDK